MLQVVETSTASMELFLHNINIINQQQQQQQLVIQLLLYLSVYLLVNTNVVTD